MINLAPAALQSVRLVIWSADERDVGNAAFNVQTHPDYPEWDIAATEQTVSARTTIAPADPDALAQRAGYGWAWAVYPLVGRDTRCIAQPARPRSGNEQ